MSYTPVGYISARPEATVTQPGDNDDSENNDHPTQAHRSEDSGMFGATIESLNEQMVSAKKTAVVVLRYLE